MVQLCVLSGVALRSNTVLVRIDQAIETLTLSPTPVLPLQERNFGPVSLVEWYFTTTISLKTVSQAYMSFTATSGEMPINKPCRTQSPRKVLDSSRGTICSDSAPGKLRLSLSMRIHFMCYL